MSTTLASIAMIVIVIGAGAAVYVESHNVQTVTETTTATKTSTETTPSVSTATTTITTTATTTITTTATTTAVSTTTVSVSGSGSIQPVNSGGTASSCPSSPGASTVVAAPSPNYDVQEVMVFTQTYTQLQFNVTAVAQCDANGYGPAYLLNGLSNTGYWYQVGINWDWPLQSGGYSPGFGFVSEAWAPGGLTRSPASVAFSGPVKQGDTVELSLSFSGGRVVTSARDLNTGASGSMSYPAGRADSFVGSQAQQSRARFSFATRGYFTGLMTEWYHVNPGGSSAQSGVNYSENVAPIASATLGVGEWNFTSSVPSSVFSSVANNGNPVDFSAKPDQLQQFTLDGLTLSADAYSFVTGPK